MNPCPRCNVPLLVEEHGDITMEICGRCCGRWMDPDDLKGVLHVIKLPVDGPAVRTGVDLTDVPENALCPRCGLPMEPFNYAGDSGVILDKCQDCGGLWLDRGNLERVLAVVAASEQDLGQDIKRFSADLHEAEVRQDALERQDTDAKRDPLVAALASRIADADPRP